MQAILVMNAEDNVATCLRDMKAGEGFDVQVGDSSTRITLIDDIPFGHKFALAPIDPEQRVIKYGEVIGIASRRIEPGEYVHVHNVESNRARGDKHAEGGL